MRKVLLAAAACVAISLQGCAGDIIDLGDLAEGLTDLAIIGAAMQPARPVRTICQGPYGNSHMAGSASLYFCQ